MSTKHRALEIGYYVTGSNKHYFYVTKNTHRGTEFNPADNNRPASYNSNTHKYFMRKQGRNKVWLKSRSQGSNHIDPGEWVEDYIQLTIGLRHGDIMQIGAIKFQKLAETVLAYNQVYNKNSGLRVEDFCVQYADIHALRDAMNI